MISVQRIAITMIAVQVAWTLPAAGAQAPSPGASVPIPKGTPVTRSSLACQAVLRAVIEPVAKLTELQAQTALGSDRLAIEIAGATLRLITRVSVEGGNATPAEFRILRNNSESLVAVLHEADDPSSTVETFVLNKGNGLAVWTKSRPFFLFDSEPDVQAFYLQCR